MIDAFIVHEDLHVQHIAADVFAAIMSGTKKVRLTVFADRKVPLVVIVTALTDDGPLMTDRYGVYMSCDGSGTVDAQFPERLAAELQSYAEHRDKLEAGEADITDNPWNAPDAMVWQPAPRIVGACLDLLMDEDEARAVERDLARYNVSSGEFLRGTPEACVLIESMGRATAAQAVLWEHQVEMRAHPDHDVVIYRKRDLFPRMLTRAEARQWIEVILLGEESTKGPGLADRAVAGYEQVIAAIADADADEPASGTWEEDVVTITVRAVAASDPTGPFSIY